MINVTSRVVFPSKYRYVLSCCESEPETPQILFFFKTNGEIASTRSMLWVPLSGTASTCDIVSLSLS